MNERTITEPTIQESEEKFRLLFEKSMDPILLVDGEVFIDCNEAALKFLRCSSKDQVIGLHPFDMSPERQPDGRLSSEKARDILRTTLKEGLNRFEWVRRDFQGKEMWIEVSHTVVPIRGKEIIRAVWRDISERKEGEALLRESEERYRIAIEHSSDAVLIVREQTHLYVNQRFLEMFGYSHADEVIGKGLEVFIHPDDVSRVRQYSLDRQAGKNTPSRYEFRGIRRDGETILGEVSAARIVYHGEPASLCYIRDVTERKASEEVLRKSRAQLSEAIELANIVYWERDPTTEAFIFNDPFYTLYGTTAEYEGGYTMTGQEYVRRFLHPDDLTSFHEAIEKRRSYTGREFVNDLEHRIVRRDGEVRYVMARIRAFKDESGRTLKCYGANQDITERKQMQEKQNRLELQLSESQKREAIGTLAGGIAHDFNNMLAVIIGNAELAFEDDNLEDIRANLNQILSASRRSRDLVKQILTFSRKSVGQKEVTNLIPLIEETVGLLRGSLPSTIAIKVGLRVESCSILGNPSQIQQVLINLATNASHAMRDDGTLAIRLSEVALKEGDQMPEHGMKAGRYARLTVRDTGGGIPSDIRGKIFDPFFTTKEPGQGTGMGLAVVFGIVKSHGGAVTVQSKMGKGSIFSVFLPMANETAAEECLTDLPICRGTERVLVIDDEYSVIQVVSGTLKRVGYEVTTARSGSEGWRKFEQSPYRFDIVVTDQTMPEMTGTKLAEKMLGVRPDLPIILFTGYSEAVSAEEAAAVGISRFLMKPIEGRRLAEAVRTVLDNRSRDSARH